MDLIKFLFVVFLCIGGCIGLMKWIDTWGKENKMGKQQIKLDKDIKKEIEEEVKKKATPKIQSAINYREVYLKKQKENYEKERAIYERTKELKERYPWLSMSEIHEKLKKEDGDKTFFKCLSVGNKQNYFDFLDLYVENGGIATHHYENCYSDFKPIYIAKNEIEIFSLYGSNQIMVIIMPNCKIIDGDPGHNNFYCYDDILNQKYASWIPTYQDWAERFEKCI